MNSISVVMNVHNESHHLEECVDSLRTFADEIVVCDMMSTDGGGALAQRLGCIVFPHPHREVVEQVIVPMVQRATGPWILLFDPDMRLPAKTAQRLKDIVAQDEADVVQFHLRNRVFGRSVTHGHGSRGVFTKFFKKQLFLQGGQPEVKIHSMVDDTLRRSTDRWMRLEQEYYLDHHAYDDLHSCFAQHLRYAKYEADEKMRCGERFHAATMLWETARKLVGDVVVRSAWRDGMPSIIFSCVASLMVLQTHLLLWDARRQSPMRNAVGTGKE